MIDELERLRAFEASQPAPDEVTRSTARARLEQAIRGSRGRRRRLRLAGAVAIGLAALAAAAALVPGSASSPSPAVAAVLNQVAAVAARQRPYAPGPGRYLYVDSRSDYQTVAVGREVCTYTAPEHRQVWIGADGSGLLRESYGWAMFTSPADRAVCLRQGHPGQFRPYHSDLWFAPRCFQLGPTNDMAALSTDPRVLLRQMRRIDGGPSTPAEDLVHVGDFLRETDASPALRAALYRAAALIPGVRLLGRVRDHLGRPGLGVAFERPGSLHAELIFDPRTSELLAEQYYAPDGRLSEWAAYLSQRVVGSLPARSPLPLRPPCVNGAGFIHQTPRGEVQTGAPVKR